MHRKVPDLSTIPHLGACVELVALREMNVDFDANYLTSQEHSLVYYRSSEGVYYDGSDYDLDTRGGIENMLWPPELLIQARIFGRERKKHLEDRLKESKKQVPVSQEV